ncbi:MAG: RNA polymerase sigma factor [Oscillospiraceae bacterium]|nr:RNA polymerase sigma factor [Oscillospiraceae bacterium]
MLQFYLLMVESVEDIDKFTEIYNKYKHMMYRVALSILKKPQDAEDAVQEAFFRLAKNISKIDEVSCKKTEAFLVILSRSVSINIYNKNRKEKGKVDLGEEVGMDSVVFGITPDALNEVLSKEGYSQLKELIEELDDTYKDTLKLRFIFEWSNEEIANFLGISKNTVEVRINRGRAKIIKALEKEGYYADKQ